MVVLNKALSFSVPLIDDMLERLDYYKCVTSYKFDSILGFLILGKIAALYRLQTNQYTNSNQPLYRHARFKYKTKYGIQATVIWVCFECAQKKGF